MQFLANKFNFNFATSAATSDAYSPFARHIQDIENKRSRLFPDRRRIPGRKAKYILAICFVIHGYSIIKLKQHKQIYAKKAEQQVSLQRKVAPFFQASQDIQYTILKHRWDLLTKEVLGEEFVKKSNFHNRHVTWAPMNRDHYGWVRSGIDRYVGGGWAAAGDRYVNGYEVQNI